MCMTSPQLLISCTARKAWSMRMLATRELRSEKRCKAGGSASALPCDQGSVELPDTPEGRLDDLVETAKAPIRAKGEHPFRVIKQQFGFQKTRLRGMLLPRPQAERGGATRTAAK